MSAPKEHSADYFTWNADDIQMSGDWGESGIPEIESESEPEPKPAKDRAGRLHRALDRVLDKLGE